MREWVAEGESTLKNFTDEHDPQASFYFTRLLKNREIKVNGKRAEKDMPVSAGGCNPLLSDERTGRKARVLYGVRG